MAPPDSGSLPLGSHHFYYTTLPCPTAVEECGGEYTEATPKKMPNPAAGGRPTAQRVGALSCPKTGGRQFTILRVDDNTMGVTEPGSNDILGTYSAGEDHHLAILCTTQPKPGNLQCGLMRFATRDQALESMQANACPESTIVDGGEIMQLELHIPHTLSKARRSVVTAQGDAVEIERDMQVVGVGGGLSWTAPRSWWLPLTLGVYGSWASGSPASVTGNDTIIDVERKSVFGHVGMTISSDWIRQMVVGSPVAAWPVEFFIAGEYHVGYDNLSGTYTFPHTNKSFSIDDSGLNHFPAFMLGMTITFGPCAKGQCPKVSNLDLAYSMGFGGVTGGSRGEIHESINQLDAIARLGLGTYEQTAVLPAKPVKVPSGSVPALEDNRPAVTRPAHAAPTPTAAAAPTMRLERVSLEDKNSFVRSMVLHFDTNKSTITSESRDRLNILLSQAGQAQAIKQSSFIHLNFEGHADSRNTDGYNLTLSTKRADTTKTDLGNSLDAHPEFGPIMREPGKVTIDSIGLGETKPLDAAGRIIDTEGCKETTGKNRVVHSCDGERIKEDLNKSRRVELFIQGEATDIAIQLKRNKPDPSTQEQAMRTLHTLQAAKRVVNGADIYPLSASIDGSGLSLSDAFANYYLLKSLPRRRFVSVVISGEHPDRTDSLVEHILPTVRTGRSTNVDVVKMVEGRLGDDTRVFVVVHPNNVEWNMTNETDANVKAVLGKMKETL